MRGKVVVITGASRGLGREVALCAARRGMHVVLNSRTKSELENVGAEVESLGAQAVVAPADISDHQDVLEMVRTTMLAYGRVDVLVNNAAAFTGGPVVDTPVAEFDRVLAVNLRGTFLVTKAFLPGMISHGGGDIVMVSSTSGLRGDANGAVYAMTKSGLRGFAQALFAEVRTDNIRVTTVFPSAIMTRPRDPATFPKEGAGVPLTGEDVGEAILDAVRLPGRAVIRELELWCTNP